jgi:hypothetical protein
LVSLAETTAPGAIPKDPDTLVVTSKNFGKEEVPQMKKLFVPPASPTADTVVCAAMLAGVGAALLAGKDDIRRFWRIHKM